MPCIHNAHTTQRMASKHHLLALFFLFLTSLTCHFSLCAARHSWVELFEDLRIVNLLERGGRCDIAPTQLAALNKSMEYGGKSGDAFDIDSSVVPNALQSVSIRADNTAVIALEFVYATKNGAVVKKGPYGGQSGGVNHQISMSRGEHVTKITVYYGKNDEELVVIRSLTIFTNARKGGYGPYGPQEGTGLNITGQAVAFFGHAGNVLYGIGVYTVL